MPNPFDDLSERDDAAPPRRRTRRQRSVWPFVLAALILLGLGVGVVLFATGRYKLSGVPDSVAATGSRWTERELTDHLKAKGVRLNYHGGGAMSRYDTWEEAKLAGHVAFQHHATAESARLYVGSTVKGFQWGQWSFVEAGAFGSPELAADTRKALGVK